MMNTSAPRDSKSARVVDNVGSVARASIAEHHIEPCAYNTSGTAAQKIVKIIPFLTNAQMFIEYYNPKTNRADHYRFTTQNIERVIAKGVANCNIRYRR